MVRKEAITLALCRNCQEATETGAVLEKAKARLEKAKARALVNYREKCRFMCQYKKEEALSAEKARAERAKKTANDRAIKIAELEATVASQAAKITDLDARDIDAIRVEAVDLYKKRTFGDVMKNAVQVGAKKGRGEGFRDGFERGLAKISRLHPGLHTELASFSMAIELAEKEAAEAATEAVALAAENAVGDDGSGEYEDEDEDEDEDEEDTDDDRDNQGTGARTPKVAGLETVAESSGEATKPVPAIGDVAGTSGGLA